MTTARAHRSLLVALVLAGAGACSQGLNDDPAGNLADGGTSTPGFGDGAASAGDAPRLGDARASGGGFIDAGPGFTISDGGRPVDGRPGSVQDAAASRPDAGSASADAPSFFPDASASPDAGSFSDASAGMGGTGGTGAGGAGGSGGGGGSGTGGSGGFGGAGGAATPPDAGRPPDAQQPPPTPCVVELRAVGAGSLAGLLAGSGATSTVRAEVVGRGVSAPLTWQWDVFFEGSRVNVTPGQRDSGVIRFSSERAGTYSLRASTVADGSPCASATVMAVAINPLSTQESNYFRAVVVPPSGANDLALFSQILELYPSGDVDTRVAMSSGTRVSINPVDRAGVRTIPSYVRIVSPLRLLSFDGFAGTAAFSTRLDGGVLYDVLVVPSGPDGSGLGAQYAPVLFPGLEVGQLAEPERFRLDRGISVRGRVTDTFVRGQPNTRVVLRGAALASTVGATDSGGFYEVLAQPGRFSVVVSPPPDTGLPEVVFNSPELVITDAADAPRVDVQWRPRPFRTTRVAIRGLDGQPAGSGLRVRAQANLTEVAVVGIVYANSPGSSSYASGIMRSEAVSTAGGFAEFPALPHGSYTVTVLPDPLRDEAITTATMQVGDGLPDPTITLVAKVPLAGRLTGTGDLSKIRVVATDVGADVLAAPEDTETAADGSFTLRVSPRRRYLLVAHPPAGSPHARTFIGAGPQEATDFVVTQKLHARRTWVGRVFSADNATLGIAGAVIKAYCYPGVIECPDPKVPLAEAVSGPDGNFTAALPDIVKR